MKGNINWDRIEVQLHAINNIKDINIEKFAFPILSRIDRLLDSSQDIALKMIIKQNEEKYKY